MKLYIGTKMILGEPMNKFDAAQKISRDMGTVSLDSDGRSEEGYLVRYPDGYESWSPKATFENAYRELSNDENRLMHHQVYRDSFEH